MDVCIANIGPQQRRIRLLLGLGALGGAALVVAAPYVLGLDPLLRYASLPLVFGGLQGVFQHREKT